MGVVSVESTELFVGSVEAPLQVVRVSWEAAGAIEVTAAGHVGIEVGVDTQGAAPGTRIPARAVIEGTGRAGQLVGAGPGGGGGPPAVLALGRAGGDRVTAVAWVSGLPVDVSEVDNLESGLRAGPVGPMLPREHTSEGRQLRRWLVQVLVAERVVAAEAEARGFDAAGAPELFALAPDRAALFGPGSAVRAGQRCSGRAARRRTC